MSEPKYREYLNQGDCESFVSCKAPLCPMDPELNNAVWYPIEPICRASKFRDLPWVKNQVAIRKLLGRNGDAFFSLKMLRAIRVVKPGLQGADPKSREGENQWFDERRSRGKTSQKESDNMATRKQEKSKNMMLVAIEYEKNAKGIFRKIRDVLKSDAYVKGIDLFEQQRATSSVSKTKAVSVEVKGDTAQNTTKQTNSVVAAEKQKNQRVAKKTLSKGV